jgi:Arc/MetJ-type ribon-helix-helix transcriptional regulator
MSTQIVNISLPKDLVKKIDSAAQGEYASRSEYIRQAVLNRLRAQEKDVWAALEEVNAEVSTKAQSLGYKTDQDFEQLVKQVRKTKNRK